MQVITLPIKATLERSADLVRAFHVARQTTDAVLIDAEPTVVFDPFGAALLASLMAQRSQKHLSTALVGPRSAEAALFLSDVGLDKFAAGEASLRGTLELRQLRALDPNYTASVTALLVRQVPGITTENSYPIELCLNELLQNVFEWSRSDTGCVVLARWYPRTRSVKLCVVDTGIGIPAELRRTQVQELHRSRTDAEVLEAAVTRPRLTSRANQVGGLGLKTIREVVTMRKGRLTVLSLGAKLSWMDGRISGMRSRPPVFRGTAVEVEFRPETLVGNANEQLSVF